MRATKAKDAGAFLALLLLLKLQGCLLMVDRENRLRGLNENLPLGRKLKLLNAEISRRFPFVARLAVAVFDPKPRVLKTFLSSGEGDWKTPRC